MNESPNNERTERVLFMVVLVAGLVGTLIGVPWTVAVSGDPATAWMEAGSSLLLLLPASAAGVWLGRRVCLGSRARELVSESLGRSAITRMGLPPAVLVGLALGGAGFVAQNSLPEGALTSGLGTPSTSAWLLRCLSAALTEEIFFRFGLLTLFVWLVVLIAKKPASWVPVLWVGNLLSAVAFAFAHLPRLTPGGSSFVIPVLAFSTVAGMAMGWLYIRQGLIAAFVGHFIADVVVYVVPRLAAGSA